MGRARKGESRGKEEANFRHPMISPIAKKERKGNPCEWWWGSRKSNFRGIRFGIKMGRRVSEFAYSAWRSRECIRELESLPGRTVCDSKCVFIFEFPCQYSVLSPIFWPSYEDGFYMFGALRSSDEGSYNFSFLLLYFL